MTFSKVTCPCTSRWIFMDFIVFKTRETLVYSVYIGHPPHNTAPWAQLHSHTTITSGTYSDILQDWKHMTKNVQHMQQYGFNNINLLWTDSQYFGCKHWIPLRTERSKNCAIPQNVYQSIEQDEHNIQSNLHANTLRYKLYRALEICTKAQVS